MNRRILFLNLLCTLLTLAATSCPAQQQLTHTATKENISCNYDCTILDIADLNNNPGAILFVSSVADKGAVLNQHLIGAYYFKAKWHIFNLDGRPIPVGSKFSVSYLTTADEKHFQYSFKREDLQNDGAALIDHSSLNNNPSAKFSTFLSWDPNSQGATTNREEIKTEYNSAAGKWSVRNLNGKPLFAKATYNISLSSPGDTVTRIITPKTLMPINGLAATPSGPPLFANIAFMHMTAWADGVLLPGPVIKKDQPDKTEIADFEMEGSNTLARKNSYQAITVRIASGFQASVPLLNAFIKKQNMIFTLEGFGISNQTGKEELVLTIKLSGAYISGYKQKFYEIGGGESKTPSMHRCYDEIKIMFTKIEYINSAGVTATDNL